MENLARRLITAQAKMVAAIKFAHMLVQDYRIARAMWGTWHWVLNARL